MVPAPASPMTPGGSAGMTPPGAPMGSSPATQPTPNPGYAAAGKQKLAIALKALQEALQMYGASSEEGQEVLKAMTSLGKLAQPGDVSPAGEANGLQAMLMKVAQAAQQQKKLQAGGAEQGAGAPAAPGAPPAPAQAA